jgi:hypothetical protein
LPFLPVTQIQRGDLEGEGFISVFVENFLVEHFSEEPDQGRVKLNSHFVGDGVSDCPQQIVKPVFEMVPFVEVEPIPLNWSQEVVVDSSKGSHDAGKAVELIMAFL